MRFNHVRPFSIGHFFTLVFLLCVSIAVKAQTIQDLGELGASNLEVEFKTEIAALNSEINQPPANSNVEPNPALIAGYNSILESFFAGKDLQEEFITFLEGGILQPNDDVNTNAQTYSVGNNAGSNNPLQDVIDFISDWDIRSNDLSDLKETFDMIRTVKNQ